MLHGVNSGDRRGVGPTVFAVAVAALIVAVVAGCGSATATTAASDTGLSVAAPATESASPSSTAPAPTATEPAAATAPNATATPSPALTIGPTQLGPVSISLSAVAAGFTSPIGAAGAPGDPRLFVIQQTGQIVIVSGGKRGATFLDIAARMSCCGERGLLGLAFHPDYATNGRFFVRYTTPTGDVRISEFHVSSDPNKADAASERILLTIPHPNFGNHNGGRVEFGPDGYLYIGTGDGGSGGDPNNHGQALNTLLGKLLRIDVDHASGALPYTIPDGNPFAGQTGKLGEIWAYGLRNPYAFSFDRMTHDLWIADVGQDAYEEVDRATAESGGGAGVNFGWSVMEGAHCYKPQSGCNTAGIAQPLAEYAHGSGDSIGCAIIGGYVYRGTAHPDLDGRYFFGDYCSGRIWDVTAAGPAKQTPQDLLRSGLKITGWGQDSSGELYVIATSGVLYELI